MKLADILKSIDEYDRQDDRLVAYGKGKDIRLETEVKLLKGNQELKENEASLLMIWQLKDVVDAYRNWRNIESSTPDELLKAVVYYFKNDAFLPVERES